VQRGGRRSGNIEDRRGLGPVVAGGGLGTAVLALLAYVLLGVPPEATNELVQQSAQHRAPEVMGQTGAPTDEEGAFMSEVLASTEDVWGAHFRAAGADYPPTTLVLYDQATPTRGCGLGTADVGPFYCPIDHKVYLDLTFFRALARQLGAPGDFAQAYVLAHEVGHHVQDVLGTTDKVRAAEARAGRAGANALSVRVELQADCYAGVWAHDAQKRLDPGDIEEALRAAAAVGDDALTQGRVPADAFTHGTSEQRVRWFTAGYRSGDPGACDTFASED
jgi:predicted metalloprotease